MTSAGAYTQAKNGGMTVYKYPDLGYYDIRFNDRTGHPFNDENVRKAFAYALDKDSVIKTATDSTGVPMWGDMPPVSWAYDDTSTIKYKQDVAKANSLMDAAGWVKGADGIRSKAGKKFSYDLCVRAGKPMRQKSVEIVAEQVRAIGMDLKVKAIDFKVYYKAKAKGGCGIQTGEFDIGFAGWGLNLDPDDYTTLSPKQVSPEVDKQGQNWTGYSSTELGDLIDQERATVKATDADTKAARRVIFNKIQKHLGDHLVTYFMYADSRVQGFSPKVGGIVSGAGGDLNYDDQGRNPSVFADWYLQ
jgi:peptide/nickel transport system substrate-binding protein